MSTPPTSLSGYMDDQALGFDGYGSLVDYLLEQIPELMHPYSVRTFAKMRHEPQLAAITRAYILAMTRAQWMVNGAGCQDEVTQRVADDLGLPIKGVDPTPTGARRRGFTWAKHLQTVASLRLTFGHAPFAQQWNLESGDRWRLGMVQERMPQTISTLKLNTDGTLKAAVQGGFAGSRGDVEITTANSQLVWYAREREGSNYFGRSLIRESYGPWLIKDQMLRVHATSIRRFGMGIPGMEAPAGATPQQIAEGQRIIANYRASEHAGLAVPAGWKQTLTGMTGSAPDALGFIQYLDRQMTRSTLTSILDMATAEKGNRSLGETVMQLMIYAQQAEAQAIAGDATEQISIPLVDANWSEDEPAPVIEVSDVGADEQLTAQDLNWLLEYGGIRPDMPARAWIRQRYGVPAEDPNDPIFQQPDPSAPTTGTPENQGIQQ